MNLQLLNQTITHESAILYPRVNAVFNKIIGVVHTRQSNVNVHSFVARMNAALKGTKVTLSTEVTKRFGTPQDTDGEYYPAMGGYCFEPSSPSVTARIKLIMCIHPDTNRIPLSIESWEYFRWRFLKCLTHELVHRAQFKNGRKQHNVLVFRPQAAPNLPKSALREQEYLGDMDEVEAYAHDCANEWYYLNPNIPLTLRAIKQEFRNHGGRSSAIQYYYDTFFGDETHPSVQRLFRKIKKWDGLICPISRNLPKPPLYVRQKAAIRRNNLLG